MKIERVNKNKSESRQRSRLKLKGRLAPRLKQSLGPGLKLESDQVMFGTIRGSRIVNEIRTEIERDDRFSSPTRSFHTRRESRILTSDKLCVANVCVELNRGKRFGSHI
ncbi:hypothetical protein EVAR_61344_1 [Eumeta japonica]|uniref:Uncharacterized protein n=1 Tax=Eumeta variegata TaxID=151549 RepID=A0A4C1Y4U5_EUMVA|nr:hypothetical protein EVAR_61344_1 [Eumeta japonica]